MKYSLNIFFTLLTVALLYACTKGKEKIEPSDIKEYGYLVPQGNNPYDQRIVNYYNRFGSTLLYKFNSKDAYWSITQWDSSYRIIPADPNFVDKQLDLLDSTFFRYYQDSTLRKYLPAKFLLCSSILFFGSAPQLDCYLAGSNPSGLVYETFLANWGSNRILNIRGVLDSAVIFRGNINYGFLRLMDIKSRMGRSNEFVAFSNYTTPIPNTTQAARYKRGFLSTSGSTTPPAAQSDWFNYLQAAVQNPYSYLTDATGLIANNTTMQGILTPVKDSSGLIRRKYDAMLNYYLTNYNIDLKRIGDGR